MSDDAADPPDLAEDLEQAILDDDVPEALRLIAAGADVHHPVEYGGMHGTTLLCLAAMQDHLDVVRALVAGGADVNEWAIDDQNLRAAGGGPALLYAAVRKRKDVYDFLLPLTDAKLVDEIAPYDPYQKSKRSKPLADVIRAAERGDVAKLRALLAAGADVNGVNRKVEARRATPLVAAISANQPEAAAAVLEAGADPNLVAIGKDYRATPLYAALSNDRLDLVRMLLAAGARVDDTGMLLKPLCFAASAAAVELLLAAGADPHDGGHLGMAPIDLAVVGGRAEVVRALIRAGADVNRTPPQNYSFHGGSLLFTAAGRRYPDMKEHPEVLEALLEAGARVEERGPRGRTPLIEAAVCVNIGNVRVLLAAGADPNARDAKGKTALDILRERLDRTPAVDAVQALLERLTG